MLRILKFKKARSCFLPFICGERKKSKKDEKKEVAGAAADPHKESPPSASELKAIEAAIRAAFSVDRVAKALAADVNQRGNAERVPYQQTSNGSFFAV